VQRSVSGCKGQKCIKIAAVVRSGELSPNSRGSAVERRLLPGQFIESCERGVQLGLVE
jgi:hypothetical protein